MNNWWPLLALGTCFLLLFALGELLYRTFRVPAEHTRKLVHIGTGLLTLLFPVYLQHLWQVVVLCASFLLLLAVSMRWGWLPSINAVSRRTRGSILYPIIVIIIFSFYGYIMSLGETRPLRFHPLLYYYLPILVMAICDPVAAWAGSRSGAVYGQGKTPAGSLAFLVSAFVVSAVLLWVFGRYASVIYVLLLALILAIATMLAERWSRNGWDNFTIPLVAMPLLFLTVL